MYAHQIIKRNFTLKEVLQVLQQQDWKRLNIFRVSRKTRVEEIIALDEYMSIFYFEPFWNEEFIDCVLNSDSIVEIKTNCLELVNELEGEFVVKEDGATKILERKIY